MANKIIKPTNEADEQLRMKYGGDELLLGKFEPMYDVIVVGAIGVMDDGRSGIIIPSSDKAHREAQLNYTGTVVARGIGRVVDRVDLQPLNVNLGDRVCFTPIDGRDIFIEGKLYRCMEEHRLVGIIERCRTIRCPTCRAIVHPSTVNIARLSCPSCMN